MNSALSAPASSATDGCPFPHSKVIHPAAFSVIDVLPGFSRLDRRNESLNGSVMSRSIACKPFMDGNRVGLHLWFAEPVVLSRVEGSPALQMTDELFEVVHGQYEEKLRTLVERGLLVEGGFWHRRLLQGPVVREGKFASIWTGLMVKPAAGLWLLATGAYNRRAEVNVRDVVFGSDEGYTPLILDLDLDTMMKDVMWLEAELACLVPLRPGVTFGRSDIRQRVDLGAKHNEFYSEKYLDTRAGGRGVGQYRKLLAQHNGGADKSETAECELVHIAGPDVHTIETFERIVGPLGPMPEETAAKLPFVVLRNFTRLEFDFDGIQSHLNNEEADPHRAELLAVWSELYGETGTPAIEWWANYFLPNVGSLLGEPQVLIIPYAFVTTPPGWSTLADGAHFPGLDGLRGVIATDLFHHAGPVLQYRRPGDFQIKEGDALMRLLPVPRDLLDAAHEMVDITS